MKQILNRFHKTELVSLINKSQRGYQSINDSLHRVQLQPKPKVNFKPSYKTVRLKFGSEARNAIIRGVSRLSETVQITLGPEYEGGDPKITKDGVTVVKSIIEPIREEDMGARMMKKIAGNTNLYAGDGTTTSFLLGNQLLKKGYFAVEFAGAHPIGLKRGMDKALLVVLDFLKNMAMPVTTEDEIFNICMVSSNYNQEIARIVAQTMDAVGLEGNVNIVESPTGRNKFNLVNGLIYERGFVSDNFVTEFKVQQKCELEFPLVLVVGNKVKTVQQISHILEVIKPTKRSFVLFSEDLQEDPLSMMVFNNSKGIIQSCAVNVPWMANVQKEQLRDIAIQTGATLVDDEYELKLEDVKIQHFGSAKKIVVDGYNTHIVGGSGVQEKIDDRLYEIQLALAQEKSPHLKQILRDRYQRMRAKIAEIEVGGRTEAERGELRDIIVDSLNSAKAAMMSGLLPGGGVALYQASKALRNGLQHLVDDENERIGVQVMADALQTPLRMVIENKIGKDCGHIINKIEESNNIFAGFDCRKGKFSVDDNYCVEEIVDMVDTGVVDSLNVIKTVLQDSVSLAALPLDHYQSKREIF
ncbi:chaperonin cpn60-mitochondrial-like [Stylonychia lemnae]|uniref:Chaperonin cpn60-mitochondrial-like n=1 Tax=Stylonychia lemnae TaxID=5949 RepID=A0A078AB30_STYLE|nr:chaperonin cpn60-mitochondrial-like [Stylonychia lemnae]|eukprot:CDW79081.1 chaperonin cpn60-mitochondrial-like [Stylonychia lemnae]